MFFLRENWWGELRSKLTSSYLKLDVNFPPPRVREVWIYFLFINVAKHNLYHQPWAEGVCYCSVQLGVCGKAEIHGSSQGAVLSVWPGWNGVWLVLRLGWPFALESTSKQFPNSTNPPQTLRLCWMCVCVGVCVKMCTSLCVRGWGDYGGAFTLSGQRDGSASSVAPPIPDHSPGISRLLSRTESTALNSPSTGPESSEPLTFTALFAFSLMHLLHPFLLNFTSLSVPPLLAHRGRLLMWENSQGAG